MFFLPRKGSGYQFTNGVITNYKLQWGYQILQITNYKFQRNHKFRDHVILPQKVSGYQFTNGVITNYKLQRGHQILQITNYRFQKEPYIPHSCYFTTNGQLVTRL